LVVFSFQDSLLTLLTNERRLLNPFHSHSIFMQHCNFSNTEGSFQISKDHISTISYFGVDDSFHLLMDNLFDKRSFFSTSEYSGDIIASLLLIVGITAFRYTFQPFIQRLVSEHHIVDNSKSVKFSESAFKFLYYSIVWIWGASITLSADFFWNPILCLENFPSTPISLALKWLYITQFSFYFASFICQFTIEVRRKDFYEMLLHHGVTAALIGLSYVYKVHRFGALVLVLHDVCDIFLEGGKMFIYSGYRKTGDAFFLTLMATWLITRMVIYPYKVIYTTAVLSLPIAELFNVWTFYFVINALLIAIQCLNVMWFGMMVRLLMNVILKKENVDDSREEDDEDLPSKKQVSPQVSPDQAD